VQQNYTITQNKATAEKRSPSTPFYTALYLLQSRTWRYTDTQRNFVEGFAHTAIKLQ